MADPSVLLAGKALVFPLLHQRDSGRAECSCLRRRGGRGKVAAAETHPSIPDYICWNPQSVAHTLCPSQKFFSFQNQLNLAQPWLHFASESHNSGCHPDEVHTSDSFGAFTLFLPHFCTHMPTSYYIPPDVSPCKACPSTAFHLSEHTYHLPGSYPMYLMFTLTP